MITPYEVARQIRSDIIAEHDPSNPRHAVIQSNTKLLRMLLTHRSSDETLLYTPFLNAAEAYLRYPNHKAQVIQATEEAIKKIEAKRSSHDSE